MIWSKELTLSLARDTWNVAPAGPLTGLWRATIRAGSKMADVHRAGEGDVARGIDTHPGRAMPRAPMTNRCQVPPRCRTAM